MLPLLFVTSLPLSFASLSDLTCLDESERATITFSNNPGVAVPNMPVVRIQQCGYEAQCSLNWVAYTFMKEKLGINVTFYPTDTPGFGQQSDDPLVDASTYSGPLDAPWNGSDPGYPENYYWWLWQDLTDLTFEFWPTQYWSRLDEFSHDYIFENLIDFGGFIGAYGEESWYIPQYYVASMPTSIVPDIISTDATYRAALINASAFGGSSDWIATYPTSAFDANTYSRPTVWGSWASYFMSKYSNALNTHVMSSSVEFVTIGSESNVAEIVNDLYGRRLPFLANIYTTDINFATQDPAGSPGSLQQFEKVAFARNPDQSLYDPCFVNRTCQYPVHGIMKAANTRLQSRFPEAHDFFTGFTISTSQIQKITSYYLLADSSLTEAEKWWNATCTWLKSSESEQTWNNPSWLVDIVRKDCKSGCGIRGYGGYCDYYVGECVCTSAQLFSDTNCTQSCPGLDGPFMPNGTFHFCDGAGTCDLKTRLCKCNAGYGGDGCQIKYSDYSLPIALNVVILLFSSMEACVCIACIIWLRLNSHYKTVKALSVDMTTIMTVGLLMIVCSNIALAQDTSSITCIAWQWLFGLGGILAIMSPLLKAYRVSRVFHGGKMLRAVKITDKMLMQTLVKCAFAEAIICSAYSFFHEFNGGTIEYFNHQEYRVETQCNDDSITNYISMGSYAFFFVALCALTKYSYGTRRALSVFKESTCAYFSSFLSLLCTLIVFVFYMATDDPMFRAAIQCFAIILVIAAVLVLFYGTRIYAFFTEPENRNVTDMKAAQSQTNTSFNSSVMKPGPAAAQ